VCGQEVKKDTVDEVAERILAQAEGTRFNVLFPVHTPETIAAEAGKSKGRGKKSSSDRSAGASSLAGDSRAAARARRSRDSRQGAGATISDAIKGRLLIFATRLQSSLSEWAVVRISTPESLLEINFAERFLLWSIALPSPPTPARESWMPWKSAIARREKSFRNRSA